MIKLTSTKVAIAKYAEADWKVPYNDLVARPTYIALRTTLSTAKTDRVGP